MSKEVKEQAQLMHSFSHVIFDFDGVVADTENIFAQFDCELLNDVLVQAGLPPSLTYDTVRKMAGNSGVAKLQIVAKKMNFDATPFQNAYTHTRTQKRKTLFYDTPATLGNNLLDFLKALGAHTALATNKTSVKLFNDLELMKYDKLFHVIVTCDPPFNKKPAPDILLSAAKKMNAQPENCAYIGDNTIDMLAAINAGMLPIGFIIEGKSGNKNREQELINSGGIIITDDFAELMPYIKQL